MNTLHPLGVSTVDVRGQVMARTGRDDYWPWLGHVASAAGCTQPIRLAGTINHVDADTGRILDQPHTGRHARRGPLQGVRQPPRVASARPAAKTYQRDAYQLVRAGLVGGKGVPDQRRHPPRPVRHPHRTRLRPGAHPARAEAHLHQAAALRLPAPTLPPRPRSRAASHGRPAVCFARHERDDPRLGEPLCLDCYDYHRQAVWNNQAGELWRRTTLAITRTDPPDRQASRHRPRHGQGVLRQGRRDATPGRGALPRRHPPRRHQPRQPGRDPARHRTGSGSATWSTPSNTPPRTVMFATDPAPQASGRLGHRLGRPARRAHHQPRHRRRHHRRHGRRLPGQVRHQSHRSHRPHLPHDSPPRPSTCTPTPTAPTPNGSSTPAGPSAARPNGGPCAGGRTCSASAATSSPRAATTRSPSGSCAKHRAVWQRTASTTGPEQTTPAEQPTVLVLNFLDFIGAGWLTTGDALLANTSAAMARERQRIGRIEAQCHP